MAGGMDVVVAGCGFDVTNSADVDFGSGNTGTTLSVPDANTINVTTPPAPGIVGPPEPVDVVVTNDPGGAALSSDALANGFTYDTIPIITAIVPEEGPEAGGTAVDISGFQFPTNLADLDVTFDGISALSVTSTAATLIDDAVTPPGTGTVDVVVTDTTGPASSPPFTGFAYKDRNVSGGYSNASLDGDYNYVSIKHDFAVQGDPTDDKFVTSSGNGETITFDGAGGYTVAANGDAFEVTNDGTPTTNLETNMSADTGSYSLANDGSLTMDTIKAGFFAPDANALFVATTIYQTELSNEMYVLTKAGSGSDALDFTDMTMGLVAFVHEYPDPNLNAAGAVEVIYSFQGTVYFANATDFTLTAWTQSKNTDTGSGITTAVTTGDNSSGTYAADTSGLFTLTFGAADNSAEVDLFDGDVVDGICAVTDVAVTGPQIFAGINLSSPASSPGRSVLLFMVPLGTGKSISSVGGEEGDAGWAQGLFGHEFISLVSTYLTSDARVEYDPGGPTYTETSVDELIVDDSGATASTAISSDDYSVGTNGDLTVDTPSPSIEGFVSADESVTASVDVINATINTIRLELTR
jgi:hypothetical protein